MAQNHSFSCKDSHDDTNLRSSEQNCKEEEKSEIIYEETVPIKAYSAEHEAIVVSEESFKEISMIDFKKDIDLGELDLQQYPCNYNTNTE